MKNGGERRGCGEKGREVKGNEDKVCVEGVAEEGRDWKMSGTGGGEGKKKWG